MEVCLLCSSFTELARNPRCVALGGLAEIGVWWVGLVAQCICAGTCSAVQSHGKVEKLLPARPCWELAFVSVHRDLHLSTLPSNARQAKRLLPVS